MAVENSLYSDLKWRQVRARALERDGGRCTVSRLLGGPCSETEPLHAHHIVPVGDGGAPFDLENVGTVCAVHHPSWEALRRQLVRKLLDAREPVRCPHQHRTAEGRRLCEERLARARRGEARQLQLVA